MRKSSSVKDNPPQVLKTILSTISGNKKRGHIANNHNSTDHENEGYIADRNTFMNDETFPSKFTNCRYSTALDYNNLQSFERNLYEHV